MRIIPHKKRIYIIFFIVTFGIIYFLFNKNLTKDYDAIRNDLLHMTKVNIKIENTTVIKSSYFKEHKIFIVKAFKSRMEYYIYAKNIKNHELLQFYGPNIYILNRENNRVSSIINSSIIPVNELNFESINNVIEDNHIQITQNNTKDYLEDIFKIFMPGGMGIVFFNEEKSIKLIEQIALSKEIESTGKIKNISIEEMNNKIRTLVDDVKITKNMNNFNVRIYTWQQYGGTITKWELMVETNGVIKIENITDIEEFIGPYIISI